ncbi:SsgA family sporulation/cell division regulator [Streptomyces massasporeus]|uniref:SsgA family sporulation/cell division regulator n=1 Tax=Streptomyces massasporeus TaxID=67324 RepID=UPI0037AACF34
MPCRFRYGVNDPYAVSIDIMPTTEGTVTWVVARDLLNTGTRSPSGEGDFRVWPSCRQHSAHRFLYFSLDVPEGQVTFEMDLTEIRLWLDATYRSVPAGSESRLLDWDSLETALLGQD